MVPVDLREVGDALLSFSMVRRVVERGGHSALRVSAIGRVAPHLEREDARDIRRERHRLQIEHQFHVV